MYGYELTNRRKKSTYRHLKCNGHKTADREISLDFRYAGMMQLERRVFNINLKEGAIFNIQGMTNDLTRK